MLEGRWTFAPHPFNKCTEDGTPNSFLHSDTSAGMTPTPKAQTRICNNAAEEGSGGKEIGNRVLSLQEHYRNNNEKKIKNGVNIRNAGSAKSRFLIPTIWLQGKKSIAAIRLDGDQQRRRRTIYRMSCLWFQSVGGGQSGEGDAHGIGNRWKDGPLWLLRFL